MVSFMFIIKKLMQTQLLDIATPNLFVATIKESASLSSSVSNDRTTMTFCMPTPILIHVSLWVIAWQFLTALTHHSLLWVWLAMGFLLILKVWKSSMHGIGSEELTYYKFPKDIYGSHTLFHTYFSQCLVQTWELVILVLQGLKLLRMDINAATSVMHWSWFLFWFASTLDTTRSWLFFESPFSPSLTAQSVVT